MKAREIKKNILDDYERSVEEYKDTMSGIKKRIGVERARIELFEYQLDTFFGIKRHTNFENE